MRRLCQLMLTAALLAGPTRGAADDEGYPWKNGNSFEIYRVDGAEPSFQPGARITLEVLGRSLATNVTPDPEHGFHVQASIDREDLARSVAGANGKWNDALGGWLVELIAPQEPRENYRLQVFLYCGDDMSPCAETYGRAAQVVETFYFEVR